MSVRVSERSRWAWLGLVLAGLLMVGMPAAQAGGRHHHHGGGWGVSIGLPGIGLSYVDGHRGGYWGGYVNAYPRPYYGAPYRYDYPPPRYYDSYYPGYGAVYYDRPVVRRVVERTVYVDSDRRGRDRYYDRDDRRGDYGRRARYYDR